MIGETKSFIPTFGTLVAEYKIESQKPFGGKYITFEIGKASSSNIYKSRKSIFDSARQNAIFKHYNSLEKAGKRPNIDYRRYMDDNDDALMIPRYESGTIEKKRNNPLLVVSLIDYRIEYNTQRFRVKRVNVKGKYKNRVFVKNDEGKFVKFSESDWTYKRLKDEPIIDNT